MADQGQVKVTVSLPIDVARRLVVLTDKAYGTDAVGRVLLTLADHAQQGVYRPGAWERDWVTQVFGTDWLARIEPDTDPARLSADGGVIFDRPRWPA